MLPGDDSGWEKGTLGHVDLEGSTVILPPLAGVTVALSLYHGGSKGPFLGKQGHLQAPCLGRAVVMMPLCIPYPPPIQLIPLCQVPVLLGLSLTVQLYIFGIFCLNNFADELQGVT